MRKYLRVAALLVLTILIVLHRPAPRRAPTPGLLVKIARVLPCSPDVAPGERIHVVRPGRVRLNTQELSLEELNLRLPNIYRTRSRRLAFLSADPALPLQVVAEVLDLVSKHADYTAIVLPPVERALSSQPAACLDPNIHFPALVF